MTTDERIDKNIRDFLRVFSENIDIDDKQKKAQRLREVMRRIMADSYIKGSNDHYDVMVASGVIKK